MYSGTTLTKHSGRILGAHQKIDRVARRHIKQLIKNDSKFPDIKLILSFEGKNGPDGTKRKSPAQDEPWHYYSPFDNSDVKLTDLISDHYTQLVNNLRSANRERASFEAAWLAHALVDGLTPAHHYPYEEKLVELMGGKGIETRTSVHSKAIMPGKDRREKIKNNWKMWGAKGLLITHFWFEIGISTMIKPLAFDNAIPTKTDIKEINDIGIVEWFSRVAKEIAVLDIYDRYYEKGWTPKLARLVKKQVVPIIVKTVTLAWYSAAEDAGIVKVK